MAGTKKSVIDHYTRLGLIEPAARSEGKYRLYSREALNRIAFIHKCQEKRLSLDEIGCIFKNEKVIDSADISLCMALVGLSIDVVIEELKSIGKKVGQTTQVDIETLRDQTDVINVKINVAAELLQNVLQSTI